MRRLQHPEGDHVDQEPSEPDESTSTETSGRAVPDAWGTAATVAVAVGAAVVGRWVLKRR